MKTQTLGWIFSVALFGCADFVSVPDAELGPLIFVESTPDDDQRIASLTTDGQRGAELGGRHASIISPRWSPSGAMIAYLGLEDEQVRDLWLVDVDGTRLSFVRDREQLVVRDRQTGMETVVLDAGAQAHEWSRDGQHLALAGPEFALWLVTVGDGSVLSIADLRASVPNLDWGPP
ncbi:hypothetical protein [Enhygromyxa salina]|uniref:Translocation protein TolB n=1 Tax=Enhygromyxa salina TaxID=215803 RepID=A0A2S9Y5W6_9BACT|nr:hypothetical protein [Enhygromyxa salina]PRQ00499.1 hypothetical protein ENSA7_59930 [Enhygromyxa salina]